MAQQSTVNISRVAVHKGGKGLRQRFQGVTCTTDSLQALEKQWCGADKCALCLPLGM